MKCARCGAELKKGCLYCSLCGQEAQIVSEYSLLEDDFLRELLKDQDDKDAETETKEKNTQKQPVKITAKEAADQTSNEPKRNKKRKKALITGAAATALLLAVVLVVLVVRYNQNHSFSYQTQKAEKYGEAEQYEKAEACYKRALELEPESAEVRWKLAEVYRKLENTEEAAALLKEAIELDSGYTDAFRSLIAIYDAKKDYKAIASLGKESTDPAVQKLFEDYLVSPPVFALEPGSYEEEKELEIRAESGCQIFYTMDGSDPGNGGTVYRTPIELPEGKRTIRAIARNEKGIYGEERSGEYEIVYQAPAMPSVTPEGGTFQEPQTISVKVPKGCRAYYTWDGSDPTKYSERYTGPIDIPEGNNILSVVLINSRGLSSEILKCNYIYLP